MVSVLTFSFPHSCMYRVIKLHGLGSCALDFSSPAPTQQVFIWASLLSLGPKAFPQTALSLPAGLGSLHRPSRKVVQKHNLDLIIPASSL